MTENCRPIS